MSFEIEDIDTQRTYARLAGFLFLAEIALAAAASAQNPPVLVLNNVNLIDGAGAAVRPHIRIVIADGLIRAVAAASTEPLAGTAVHDHAGITVIPGLIDAHVHLTSRPGNDALIARTLRFGLLDCVTSVRDMGGDGIVLADLAKASRDGRT